VPGQHLLEGHLDVVLDDYGYAAHEHALVPAKLGRSLGDLIQGGH
jgi:hypothetical protein